jgi:hypothetical protein
MPPAPPLPPPLSEGGQRDYLDALSAPSPEDQSRQADQSAGEWPEPSAAGSDEQAVAYPPDIPVQRTPEEADLDGLRSKIADMYANSPAGGAGA